MRLCIKTKGNILFFSIIFFMIGCSGAGIPRSEYSKLETPQATIDFVRKTVVRDDAKAFYYCFSEHIKKQVSFDTFSIGWALAGKYFGVLRTAEVENIQQPAPDLPDYKNSAKITIATKELEASFLLLKENKMWKLSNPTHYGMPDISKLKAKERPPWRNDQRAYYRTQTSEWLRPDKSNYYKSKKTHKRKPVWRSDARINRNRIYHSSKK